MPSSGLTNSYSDVLAFGEIALNLESDTQLHTFYTCPAGRKARFVGTAVLTTFGTSLVGILLKPTGGNYAVWGSTATTPWNGRLDSINLQQQIDIDFYLNAGDKLQSNGENNSYVMSLIGSIKEVDA